MKIHSYSPSFSLFIGLALLSHGLAVDLQAQSVLSEVTTSSARRIGLEPIWARTLPVGMGGAVTHAAFQVHASTYHVGEVRDKFGRVTHYSERELNRLGTRLGPDEVDRLAWLRAAELKSRGLEPTSENKVVHDMTLYVTSNNGTITAMDAENGGERWTAVIGKPGYPNFPPAVAENHLAVVSGSTLFLMDPANGEITSTKRLTRAPGGGPSIYGDLIYIPSQTGLVEVYALSDLRQLKFTFGSSGQILHPLAISHQSVSWSTQDGDVYVAQPGAPGIRFRFDALGEVHSGTAVANNMIYVSSTDGFVYAIDELQGKEVWRYSTGESIRSTPFPVGDQVFVTTEANQLVALGATDGTLLWQGSGISEIVTVSDQRVYGVTRGQLVAVDRATGGIVGSIAIDPTSRPMINPTSDRVYLASRGTLQALREAGKRIPLIRSEPITPAVTEPPRSKPSENVPVESVETSDAAEGDDATPPARSAEEPAEEDENLFGDGDAGGNDEMSEPADEPSTDDEDPF